MAGLTAALTASEAGAKVCLTSRGSICSGSSFYPGTWGLGLVSPENQEDEKDLEETILRVGENMADPQMVHTLVQGIRDGVKYLDQLQIPLKKAINYSEQAYIPCFDHKNRSWQGIEKTGARSAFLRQLYRHKIQLFPNLTIYEFLKGKDGICGADAIGNHPIRFWASSVILATGGLGGLFQYHLNTDDVCGTGHYLALNAGAALVNIEFIQMMPGFLGEEKGTIYNEKVFSLSRFQVEGKNVFGKYSHRELQNKMNIRSTHGPFTTRLISRDIDMQLYDAFLKYPQGVSLTYHIEDLEKQPEFVRTYFQWLKREKGLTEKDSVQIGIFAHASNGGIAIDANGYTGVPGLYACGEVTGLMHGADRLGGLSTSNSLVFGRIAGKSAAKYALKKGRSTDNTIKEFKVYWCKNARQYMRRIQNLNMKTAMLSRSEEKSKNAMKILSDLENVFKNERKEVSYQEKRLQDFQDTIDLQTAIILSQALHQVILQRRESRGPHNRTDYPQLSEAMNESIYFRLKESFLV